MNSEETNHQQRDLEFANLISASTPTFMYSAHLLGMMRQLFQVISEPMPDNKLTNEEQQRRIERSFVLITMSLPDKKIRNQIIEEYEEKRSKHGVVNAALLSLGSVTDYMGTSLGFTDTVAISGV